MTLKATDNDQAGYHSILVTLSLENYPYAEARSYYVNVTVIALEIEE